MSKIALTGNASGTGTLTIAAPNTNTDRTLTLPDEAGTVLTSASDVAASQITTALNATGSAPLYACRAWVNFNGIGTVAIRASGNVSSITDLGTGDYRVNFTTAMPDADYVTQVTTGGTTARITGNSPKSSGGDPTVNSTTVTSYVDSASSAADSRYMNVAIFR